MNCWRIKGRPCKSSASEAFLFLPPFPLRGALGIEAVGLAGVFFLEDLTLVRSVMLNFEADLVDFPAPTQPKQDKYLNFI
ncbi:hypothetical protein HanIR_Chr16g0803701 [Helianthus annuus]|nr:hypothetical protein HanIR_Chr16g0803701 [Helianthus annuus]